MNELERWACFAIAGFCDSLMCTQPGPKHLLMPGSISTESAMKHPSASAGVGDFHMASLEGCCSHFYGVQRAKRPFCWFSSKGPAGSGKCPHPRPRSSAGEPGLRVCGFMVSFKSILMR